MECAYYYNIMKIIDIILHNIDIINYYIMYLYMACTYLCIGIRLAFAFSKTRPSPSGLRTRYFILLF